MPTPLPGSFKATLKRNSGQVPTFCAQNDAQLPHRWYHCRLPDTLSSQSGPQTPPLPRYSACRERMRPSPGGPNKAACEGVCPSCGPWSLGGLRGNDRGCRVTRDPR